MAPLLRRLSRGGAPLCRRAGAGARHTLSERAPPAFGTCVAFELTGREEILDGCQAKWRYQPRVISIGDRACPAIGGALCHGRRGRDLLRQRKLIFQIGIRVTARRSGIEIQHDHRIR